MHERPKVKIKDDLKDWIHLASGGTYCLVLIFPPFSENFVMGQDCFKDSLLSSQTHSFANEKMETWRREGTWPGPSHGSSRDETGTHSPDIWSHPLHGVLMKSLLPQSPCTFHTWGGATGRDWSVPPATTQPKSSATVTLKDTGSVRRTLSLKWWRTITQAFWVMEGELHLLQL